MKMLGWIVTYVIDVRGGGASSGYISAGFFGGASPRFLTSSAQHHNTLLGLTLGRVGLLWVNKKVITIILLNPYLRGKSLIFSQVGERRAIFLYGALAVG